MRTYYAGQIAPLLGIFEQNEAPIDPSTVKLNYAQSATRTYQGLTGELTLTWNGVLTTPTVGQIAKIASGNYLAWVDTTPFAPTSPATETFVIWEFEGSGAIGQSNMHDMFKVIPRPFTN